MTNIIDVYNALYRSTHFGQIGSTLQPPYLFGYLDDNGYPHAVYEKKWMEQIDSKCIITKNSKQKRVKLSNIRDSHATDFLIFIKRNAGVQQVTPSLPIYIFD